MFEIRDIGISRLSPFLKTGMTLANFSSSGKVPSEIEKLISLTRGFDRTGDESLSILVGILLGPTD